MTAPSKPARRQSPWDDPRLIFPDEPTWEGLTPTQKEAVIERIVAALDEYQEAMSEGTRHFRRKVGIAAELDAHFRRAGRAVYVGSELAVLYPDEPVIVPDVLAVMDCDPDMEPETWVVADQKRGIDVIIEVRNLGKKHKDLVENVSDYARRRIPEYFSFDCRSGQLRGWRLPTPASRTYQPVVPQGGYLRSNVLGLELGVVGTRLRFYLNQALIPDAAELVARLQDLVDQQQRSFDDTARRLDDSLGQLAAAQIAMASGVLALCNARGLTLTPEQHARIVTESDAATLTRWLTLAATASDAAEILSPS
ncbi:MAG: Uma2 family endonuclease [Polyangiales bacterium]